MSSVVEKITLYDLLGYMVPGAVFLFVLVGNYFLTMPKEILQCYEKYVGMIAFVFVVCSYVCGILISELARYVFAVYTFFEKYSLDEIEMKEFEKKLPLKKALQESQLIEGQINMADADAVKHYTKIMYGDIQADEKFKRIHNYTSAEVLYKNLSMAFLLCAVLAGFGWSSWPAGQVTLPVAGCLIAAFVFMVRSFDFNCKKRRYTLIWFVEKYCGKKVS